MNTPTPAQALGEVLRLSEIATDGPWEVDVYADVISNGEDVARIATGDDYADIDAALIVAAVNFIRQHGQHFAGLEAEVAILKNNLEAQEACTKSVSEAYDERNETCATLTARAEAAEARCAEAEGLLSQAMDRYHPQSALRQSIATFLAASGESK